MFGMSLLSTRVVPATLSSFCKISRETSFSELIRGTTSSCKAIFLNWILEATAATFVVVVALVSVLTGTGISVPLAIMAFLLLLVKTVGREIVRNRPAESNACTTSADTAGGKINVGAAGSVGRQLGETDQVAGVEDTSARSCRILPDWERATVVLPPGPEGRR